MNELQKSLTSPAWWLSVVAVGLALNLIAAYLKPWLDRAGSRLSGSLRASQHRAREQRAKWIELLRADPHAQFILHTREARQRARSIQSMLLGTAVFSLGVLGESRGLVSENVAAVALGFGGFGFFVSYFAMGDASKCAALLREALRDYPLPYNQ